MSRPTLEASSVGRAPRLGRAFEEAPLGEPISRPYRGVRLPKAWPGGLLSKTGKFCLILKAKTSSSAYLQTAPKELTH
jgi:hypothetical protein